MLGRRALVAALPALAARRGFAQPVAAGRALFTLGVASGDPTPDGIVLWTRLAPDPMHEDPALPGGMTPDPVPVEWVLANDDRLTDVVARGVAIAHPALSHAVHVDVGGLAPDRWYFYAFRALGQQSPIGRTRTMPAAGTPLNAARFAIVSCQNWELGYFNAYRGLADDDRLNLILQIGDYIYDVHQGDGPRQHEQRARPSTLAEWRRRYTLYKTDPDLQAAHAAAPFLVAPDNHDAADDNDESPAGLASRAAAYQAWYENIPTRQAFTPGSPTLALLRGLEFGTLVRMSIPDTRQFRANQNLCQSKDTSFGFGVYQAPCPPGQDAARSMLGRPQEAWLLSRLGASPALWNVLTSTVYFGPFDVWRGTERANYAYSWDGFPANRERVLARIAESGLANPIVLSADVHSNWAKDIHRTGLAEGPIVATEFVGTSVSALWPEPLAKPMLDSMARNPQVRYFDHTRRGYLLCDVDRTQWLTRMMTTNALDRAAPVVQTTGFAVAPGRPGVQRA